MTVAYSGFGRPAIHDVTLSIGLGKYALITGHNGAGKTTLIEACLGLLKPVKGYAKLLGVDTGSRSVIKARRLCSYVPQNFMRPPYDHYTAHQVIAMGLASLNDGRPKDYDRLVAWAAETLGIEGLLGH
ncbi:MAG: ATP-binding cassette domain-containing protein [Candidatus Nezhaarchaeota archaeon]|nr:ATP-binding cassette domain-containing protein [Candidatus Nezhaarchaeota archaeon]